LIIFKIPYLSPFERSNEENREIYEILSQFQDFKEMFSSKVQENKQILEKLCYYATYETTAASLTPGS
jgi:uncharacterized protein YktA (UPF0223 family)